MNSASITDKEESLTNILKDIRSGIIAFSGGVDSTFLLKVAHDVLGGSIVAVTAVSPTYPASELEDAKRLAEKIGARHVLIESHEMENKKYSINPSNRCYYCKDELFGVLTAKAREMGLAAVMDGTNADDSGDYRPGRKAAGERGVRSPLLEAGFSKAEIREISKRIGLPTWDKPSYACLSSRIPYGTGITLDRLNMVEKAEKTLKGLGFRTLRVRYHGEIARIEVGSDDMERFIKNGVRETVVEKLKTLGFTYVTLDLQGYRSGSMNESLRAARPERKGAGPGP